ncbi:TdeIII family type II restriction endonuclease [Candidatus Collierbacteria bacterium]|nr:TdeIII family type II restriction endonuclease [Candidatus Collierbacteria bacterium]
MTLSLDQQNRISEEVKIILLRRINSFPKLDTAIRNAPFHSAILECFRERLKPLHIELPYLMALASWLHGLNTSLGSGFENISHILSGGYKRKFTKGYKLKVKSKQASQIEEIVRNLKSGVQKPDLLRENALIFNYSHSDSEVDSLEFTVDTYIESKKKITAIEMKSVRPNSGEGRGEKQKILYGKAALQLLHPDKKIEFYLGFPFDPTSTEATTFNKERFFDHLIEFKKFFAQEEVLLADELWDFLSGNQRTMDDILNIIKKTVLQIRS